MLLIIYGKLKNHYGAPKKTRTSDPNFRKVVLYPTEL